MSNQTQGSEPEETSPPTVPSRTHDDVLPVALELWEQAGARHWITVEGQSMTPLLREGDAVLVSYGRDRVQRGSVVLFRHRNRLVAHRVLRIIEGDGGSILETKGDSLRTLDAPVPEESIVGRVVAIERKGRQIQLDSPRWRVAGWLIAVATLCAAVPVHWGRALLQRVRAGRR